MYYCFLEEMMAGTTSTNTEEIIVYTYILKQSELEIQEALSSQNL